MCNKYIISFNNIILLLHLSYILVVLLTLINYNNYNKALKIKING